MLLDNILIIAIGFSIISALILLSTYSLLYRKLNKSWISIASGVVLLLIFLVVQILHLTYLDDYLTLYASKWYSSLIILSAPAFYFFVKEYIQINTKPTLSMVLHFIPLMLNFSIENRWSIPASFLLGSVYAIISVYNIFQLKNTRQRFRFEVFTLVFFFIIAIAIALFGLGTAVFSVNEHYFFVGYGILIGLSFVLVVTTLLINPDVATNLTEAVETKYAKSTLANIDRSSMLIKLEQLMEQDKLYRNEKLDLAMLAEQLTLTTHQLSELINAEFGYGFSAYIRNYRIADAQRLLIAEPKSSILSISLTTGFTSQSSFYTAFGQIVGESPGNYRKRSKKTC